VFGWSVSITEYSAISPRAALTAAPRPGLRRGWGTPPAAASAAVVIELADLPICRYFRLHPLGKPRVIANAKAHGALRAGAIFQQRDRWISPRPPAGSRRGRADPAARRFAAVALPPQSGSPGPDPCRCQPAPSDSARYRRNDRQIHKEHLVDTVRHGQDDIAHRLTGRAVRLTLHPQASRHCFGAGWIDCRIRNLVLIQPHYLGRFGPFSREGKASVGEQANLLATQRRYLLLLANRCDRGAFTDWMVRVCSTKSSVSS